MKTRIAALVAAYPVLAWSLVALVASAVVRYVPGLAGFDVDAVGEIIATVIAGATGIVIHRMVTPVQPDQRGI
ncbi:MAG TPA: hypothetical protein VM677_27955 [Actinokineospora sp.]|nr:hypothetical protein [Actinokineospora sp.]